MAKRKGAQDRQRTLPLTNQEWAKLIPKIREHFKLEIETMLAEVPADLWEEPEICGLMYDFLPWHENSTLSIQLRSDDPYDFGGWTHYECVNPDGRQVHEEFEIYNKEPGLLVYHRLLIEAAEALLSIDFTPYRQPTTIKDGYLYKLFQLQVYHGDEKFKFNYCEYVLARRFEE
jgi:hypothetical protein